MVDFSSWTDMALRAFVSVSPSPQWANRQVEPYLGLPFGSYLRSAPPVRPRRLTGPLDPAEDSLWRKLQVLSYLEREQRSEDQEASDFVSKLPYDIRAIIYGMVLGGNVFHCSAQNHKSRVTHYICNRADRIEDEGSQHKCSNASYGQPASLHSRESSSATFGLLSLLLTCRKVYSEAVGMLYSTNTFVFSQNFAAFTFLKLMIPRQRLPSIRRFRLHMRIPRHPDSNNRTNSDWEGLWDFFGKEMTGLQSLYVELQMLQPTEAQIEATSDTQAESWLGPIILMATRAHRDRGCDVEIETRGIRHHPAALFMEARQSSPELLEAELTRQSCVALHRRIRLSLG